MFMANPVGISHRSPDKSEVSCLIWGLLAAQGGQLRLSSPTLFPFRVAQVFLLGGCMHAEPVIPFLGPGRLLCNCLPGLDVGVQGVDQHVSLPGRLCSVTLLYSQSGTVEGRRQILQSYLGSIRLLLNRLCGSLLPASVWSLPAQPGSPAKQNKDGACSSW